MARAPYTEWYENSLRYPDSPVARHHRQRWGDRPYEAFAADFEAGLEQWDPQAWAERFRGAGARYVVLVAKHHDGYCLWPTDVPEPATGRAGTPSGTWSASWPTRSAAVGLRFGAVLLGRPRLDLRAAAGRVDRRGGGVGAAGRVPRLRRGPRPRADRRATGRRCSGTTSPGPAGCRGLVRLIDHYREAVPDGAGERPLAAAGRRRGRPSTSQPARQLLDRATAKAATKQGGLVPPDSPVGDVRTPEYVSFDDIRREPWECVRGIDKSFGYNRNSRPEHFLPRDELLSMVADIAVKGGNLLLNVGPRGEDAHIPDEQLQRLDVAGGVDLVGGRRALRHPAVDPARGHDGRGPRAPLHRPRRGRLRARAGRRRAPGHRAGRRRQPTTGRPGAEPVDRQRDRRRLRPPQDRPVVRLNR